MDKLEDFYVRY